MQLNRDFYKKIFPGEKKLLHVSEVRHINVPRLKELSIKNMATQLKDDEQLAHYLPDGWHEKAKVDRDWLFNVVNSIHPGYLG